MDAKLIELAREAIADWAAGREYNWILQNLGLVISTPDTRHEEYEPSRGTLIQIQELNAH